MNNLILGTIISSVLTFDQLCREIDENPAFNIRRSSFAPYDGRTITGSRLQERAQAIQQAPDLRGKFQRGLNVMYGDGLENLPFIPDTHGDPEDNRIVNTYQGDAIIRHNHTANCSGGIPIRTNGMGIQADEGPEIVFGTPTITVDPYGESIETRPKNIAVFFYIKIN